MADKRSVILVGAALLVLACQTSTPFSADDDTTGNAATSTVTTADSDARTTSTTEAGSSAESGLGASSAGVTSSGEPTITGGAEIFAEKCAGCHGADGLGNDLASNLFDLVPHYDDDGLRDLFEDGLSIMPPQALSAAPTVELLAYLRDAFGAYTPDAQRDGAILFDQLCARCHGSDGRGNGDQVPDIFERIEHVSDEKLEQLITLDFRREGRGLRDAELVLFLDYLRTRFSS